MPVENLSDDYVAQLLAKDAKASAKNYSSYGLQALLPRRATTTAPKPNTRFLKNIIRETDSHNAALRAKEAEDLRVRLRYLRRAEGPLSNRRDTDGRSRDSECHQAKRRRIGEDDGHEDPSRRPEKLRSDRDRNGDSERKSGRHPDREFHAHRERERSHRHHHHHHHPSHRRRERGESRDRSKRERGSRPFHRSRSRSPICKERRGYHRRSGRRDRSYSSEPSARNSPVDDHGHTKRNRLSPPPNEDRASEKPDGSADDRLQAPASPGSESDPLDAIIGPPPPPPAPKVRSRGRGAFASESAIDNHFSSNYDPSLDAHPDPDLEDDWDQALEALRDRKKWQQQGAERLRSAGFTEEEVQKWLVRGTSGEKAEEDIRWKGRGEGREWDRGKVVMSDGIETRAEWGRLKGT